MIDPTRLCQIEIQVSDVERSLGFYEQVLGWRRVPTEIQEYIVLDVPATCPFGISLMPTGSGGAKAGGGRMVLYFATDDASEILARTPAHGGAVRFGPRRLPGYGEIYQIEDPDGQRIGLLVPKK